jgi:hypothetical protein
MSNGHFIPGAEKLKGHQTSQNMAILEMLKETPDVL